MRRARWFPVPTPRTRACGCQLAGGERARPPVVGISYCTIARVHDAESNPFLHCVKAFATPHRYRLRSHHHHRSANSPWATRQARSRGSAAAAGALHYDRTSSTRRRLRGTTTRRTSARCATTTTTPTGQARDRRSGAVDGIQRLLRWCREAEGSGAPLFARGHRRVALRARHVQKGCRRAAAQVGQGGGAARTPATVRRGLAREIREGRPGGRRRERARQGRHVRGGRQAADSARREEDVGGGGGGGNYKKKRRTFGGRRRRRAKTAADLP